MLSEYEGGRYTRRYSHIMSVLYPAKMLYDSYFLFLWLQSLKKIILIEF